MHYTLRRQPHGSPLLLKRGRYPPPPDAPRDGGLWGSRPGPYELGSPALPHSSSFTSQQRGGSRQKKGVDTTAPRAGGGVARGCVQRVLSVAHRRPANQSVLTVARDGPSCAPPRARHRCRGDRVHMIERRPDWTGPWGAPSGSARWGVVVHTVSTLRIRCSTEDGGSTRRKDAVTKPMKRR